MKKTAAQVLHGDQGTTLRMDRGAIASIMARGELTTAAMSA